MQRVLRNTSATLRETFYADENPTEADGDITVTLTAPDGTEFLTGTAAKDGTDYTFTVPPQTDLGFYSITWKGTFSGIVQTLGDHLEVVGGRIFTIAEARASDSKIADAAKYPAELLEQTRLEIESEFEIITGRSFVPRFRRVEGDCEPLLTDIPLIRVIRSSAPANLLPRWDIMGGHGYEGRTYGFAYSGVPAFCEYEYGFPYVPPEVKREALTRLRSLLNAKTTSIPDRATSFIAAEGGTYTMATPGRAGYETGVPSVDAVLQRYKIEGAGVF